MRYYHLLALGFALTMFVSTYLSARAMQTFALRAQIDHKRLIFVQVVCGIFFAISVILILLYTGALRPHREGLWGSAIQKTQPTKIVRML